MKLFVAEVFINHEAVPDWRFLLRAANLSDASDLALNRAEELYPEGDRLPDEYFRAEVHEYTDRADAGILEECDWRQTAWSN